jgi:hypothetical protein
MLGMKPDAQLPGGFHGHGVQSVGSVHPWSEWLENRIPYWPKLPKIADFDACLKASKWGEYEI